MKTKRRLMRVFLILNLVGWTLLLIGVSTAEAAPPQQGGTRYHTVKRGETLAGIAARYGTTVGAMVRANPNIRNRNLIYIGQRLVIPTASTTSRASVPPVSKGAPGTTYWVRSGDTLSGIALLYRTTVQAIMAANGLSNPHHIYPGQNLRIPRR